MPRGVLGPPVQALLAFEVESGKGPSGQESEAGPQDTPTDALHGPSCLPSGRAKAVVHDGPFPAFTMMWARRFHDEFHMMPHF